MTTAPSAVVVDGFVPVIDLAAAADGPARSAVAREIDTACKTSGFLVISGHGVEPALMDRMYAVTRSFFELPREEKVRCISKHAASRGFHDGGFVAASSGQKTPPDLCETFSVSHLGEPGGADPAHFGADLVNWNMPNVWPIRPAGFQATWLEYYAAMERLAGELMHLFALALGLPEGFFDSAFDHHASKLLANFYPPQTTPALPGQLRKGQHTDWGSLTILYQDGTPGLEVLHEGHGWHPVPAIPESFVINLGDLMPAWTSGRWQSTVHRVHNRRDPRLSIAYFQQPDPAAEIRPLPGSPHQHGFLPFTSRDWFKAKERAAAEGQPLTHGPAHRGRDPLRPAS